MKKSLTTKGMIDTISNAGVKERERVWTTFWNMYCLGFITRDMWNGFYEKCRGIDMEVSDMECFRF